MQSDLQRLRTFKAKYEALKLEAPNQEIRDYMDTTIHDAIDPAIYVEERTIEYAVQCESLRFSEGMGGNDPANRRGAFIEEQLSERLA